MSQLTYRELESSVNQLDLADQIRLIQTLLPRVTGAILASKPQASSPKALDAIAKIRAAGKRLSEQSPVGSSSIVDELTRSRR